MAKLCEAAGKCNHSMLPVIFSQLIRLAMTMILLQAKQNSVIDNTNHSKDVRRRYIEVAKKMKIQCRCFVMDVSFAHSKHNNIYRELTDSAHKQVNDIVMNTYR